MVSFLKFFNFNFFGEGKVFLRKSDFYKVGLVVSDGEESDSISHFSKFVNSRITLWDVNSVNTVSLSTPPNSYFASE